MGSRTRLSSYCTKRGDNTVNLVTLRKTNARLARPIGQKLHKITHDSMKNRGSTPILTNLVGVHPRNIHTKYEANLCSGSRDEVKNGILHSDI